MRFSLPLFLLAALVAGGCSTPEKRLAREEAKMAQENSRRVEEMRMRAVASGEAGSIRGASVIQYDPNKVFDPSRSGIGTVRPYTSNKKAGTREFVSREARVDSFSTRDFYGSKSAATAQKKYAARDANTQGKYLTEAGKEAPTRTAATKEAWDAQKRAPSRELADGRRLYLGPERKKLSATVAPKDLANWRNGGETAVYTDGVVEKVSTFKQLSIEDIRELLNKNK